MSLKGNLNSIKDDINKYKDKLPQELYQECIEDRLKKTVLKYNDDLDLDSGYLLHRHAVKVMKAITVLQRNTDKEILEANQQKEE